MTRRYQPGAAGGGTQRLTPSPTPQGPRAGVQVVTARAPRVGPSAAEEVDGTIAPIDLSAGIPLLGPHDSTLSNGEAGQHVVNPPHNTTVCEMCGKSDGLLIPGWPEERRLRPDQGPHICDTCIERLIDALRAELPRRRLRLAMERLAAGTVSIETVEAVERLAAGQAGKVDWGKIDE